MAETRSTISATEKIRSDVRLDCTGVSATPVREALARVETEGLVVKEPRRGYLVAPLISLENLHSLIEFRLLIEPEAAAAAARRATAEQAALLQELARSGGADDSNDPAVNRRGMDYDARFHDAVAELAGNPWLREAVVRLRSHLHMYRLYYHARQGAATNVEHEIIADAIASGDPQLAVTAMRDHLHTAIKRIDDAFASGRATREG